MRAVDKPSAPVTLVVMTRNRVDDLLRTLGHLTTLPDAAPIIVVDNGSTDATSARVRESFPDVELITLEANLGVEARNIGVRRATTPYIAFSDDDSWWSPGSLTRVVYLFDAHPRLAAIAAHVLVEPGGRDDPVSLEMRRSPVEGASDVPGVPVLGFLACSAAVRRSSFLDVGGFERRLHFLGEEQLLAADLATRGLEVRYVPEVTIHHHPSPGRDHRWRARRELRNDLWFAWLRRPARTALRRSVELLAAASPSISAPALAEAVLRGRWVLQNRAVVPPRLERQLRRLEGRDEAAGERIT